MRTRRYGREKTEEEEEEEREKKKRRKEERDCEGGIGQVVIPDD